MNPKSQLVTDSKYLILKRAVDLAGACILIIFFLPFWIVVPLLIYFDSGRPIIFKHKRVGINGKEFDIYKFRSMIPDAESILHENNQELLSQFKSGDWKIKDDPRITKIGKALRSLSIDEFPQLLNVLKGEMSLVGPRAYVKKELEEQSSRYPKTKALIPIIVSVKPGLTGIWQISGRNEIPFVKRAKLDADYASRKSILEDLTIIIRTPKAMISKW